MTLAIETLKNTQTSFIVHTYEHDPRVNSFGEEAAEKLGLSHERVFKTLIACIGTSRYACAIVPIDKQLDLKALAKAAKVKSATMASVPDAERITGFVRGGISPLGQKRQLTTFLDDTAVRFAFLASNEKQSTHCSAARVFAISLLSRCIGNCLTRERTTVRYARCIAFWQNMAQIKNGDEADTPHPNPTSCHNSAQPERTRCGVGM